MGILLGNYPFKAKKVIFVDIFFRVPHVKRGDAPYVIYIAFDAIVFAMLLKSNSWRKGIVSFYYYETLFLGAYLQILSRTW